MYSNLTPRDYYYKINMSCAHKSLILSSWVISVSSTMIFLSESSCQKKKRAIPNLPFSDCYYFFQSSKFQSLLDPPLCHIQRLSLAHDLSNFAAPSISFGGSTMDRRDRGGNGGYHRGAAPPFGAPPPFAQNPHSMAMGRAMPPMAFPPMPGPSMFPLR